MSIWLLLAAIIGCGTSHPVDVAGLDPSRRVVTLTDEEWQAFCDWREGLRDLSAGELIQYECMDGVMYPIGSCPIPAECYQVVLSSIACMKSPLDLRVGFSHVGEDCPTTVGDVARCQEAIDARPCELGIPECRTISCSAP